MGLVFIGWNLKTLRSAQLQGKDKESKVRKTKIYLCFLVLLFIGWGFAGGALIVFKKTGVLGQSFIAAFLGVWKGFVSTACEKMILKYGGGSSKKFELLEVAFASVIVHWFWTLFAGIAFASVESPVTFAVYLIVDLCTAAFYMVQCSQRSSASVETDDEDQLLPTQKNVSKYSIIKKFPFLQRTVAAGEKRIITPTIRDDEEHYIKVLYNSSIFVFVQFGEMSFAVYTLCLFYCCRYGPNSEFTPVGSSVLSDDGFSNLETFLQVAILSEVICTTIALSFASRYLEFNPLEHMGEFIGKRYMVFVVLPFMLHLPLLSLLFDQAGMEVVVGDRR
jgi:hypothetical protein